MYCVHFPRGPVWSPKTVGIPHLCTLRAYHLSGVPRREVSFCLFLCVSLARLDLCIIINFIIEQHNTCNYGTHRLHRFMVHFLSQFMFLPVYMLQPSPLCFHMHRLYSQIMLSSCSLHHIKRSTESRESGAIRTGLRKKILFYYQRIACSYVHVHVCGLGWKYSICLGPHQIHKHDQVTGHTSKCSGLATLTPSLPDYIHVGLCC